jgi:3-hydroxybutyryl-CoA dehydrogenase
MEGLYCYGNRHQREEWTKKAAEVTALEAAIWLPSGDGLPADAQLVFDFLLDETPERIAQYRERERFLVVGGGLLYSLAELAAVAGPGIRSYLGGIAAWPGMLSRSLWEVSFLNEASQQAITASFDNLGITTGIVADRVGMATPRLLSMIINEACFTVQEGTPSREDINRAMKLGVNYPGGPFEWLENFGANRVVTLLEAMYEETRNGRYKISPLLKREALMVNV